MDVIKVKANSRTAAVAGAIAGVVREHKRAEVQAIGAGAVNQAVKALVLAKGYLAKLMANEAILRQLTKKHPDVLNEFDSIVRMVTLDK